jgi:ornithine carbamoyltransferase
MKRCYRVDYDGIHDSDYIWCTDDKSAITKAMQMANEGAILNPCPPFYRGEEVSADVIDSDYFVGYEFKKHLLNVQQAIMIYCLIR